MRTGLMALAFMTSSMALAQGPTSGQMEDVAHQGWYYRGTTIADAEARDAGAGGTALVVDCHYGAPRVMVFWRQAALPRNAVTTTSAIEATFRFTRHSVASMLTQHFDTEQQLAAFGNQIAAGEPNGPPVSEHVNFDGAQARKLLEPLKAMDHVTIAANGLGPPVAFDLGGAPAAIDQLLAVCARR